MVFFPLQHTWWRCIVILYACTRQVFVLAQPKQHLRCQEPLPNHQEIFRQHFPVICLPVCQEMMEKIWRDLSLWVHYSGAPAAGLFLSVCILMCKPEHRGNVIYPHWRILQKGGFHFLCNSVLITTSVTLQPDIKKQQCNFSRENRSQRMTLNHPYTSKARIEVF